MKLKRVFAAVTAFALCASLAGCGAAASVSESAAESAAESTAESAVEAEPAATEAPAESEATEATLRIAGLKGPTTMGLVNLMADEVASSYDFTMYGAADEIVPLLVKGDLDAAAVPANLAATLYNKTNGAVEVACINTLGVLYIVENGETVNSVADLKGQTIVTTGKGTTPEYVLRYVLSENGVDPDSDVTIEYCSEATEALSKVQAGEATIAMLPQPFVTSALSQVEGLRVALDMNEEWQKVAGSKLVTGVLVVRKDAVENDPEAFASFMEGYAASVEAANSDLEGTAALCEQYGVVAKAALAQKALPQCNIVFETGDEMKADLETYFNVLYAADPTSVGGTLPADDFYYAG
ncbi:ABC transporter substrate-binding protein [Gemmiger formicilis]|uniref:ABC transporter substrate-binding protein n=1 Tax=Gemmiger formicilis TaxID=745368 RepID=UPI00210DFB8F|nr:MqnA/MqnD/SBP family protein [Gemmiger formicilis]MCQ5079636.1 ABC transporter substrate-binding protein [Gemmiger formicilis]MCQ5116432.1 ABC transporter substrate-binding protein [Gemmiger formicilis]